MTQLQLTFAKWLLIIGFTWPGALWLGSVIWERIKKYKEKLRRKRIVRKINEALDIELYPWQIAYIFGDSDYMPPGRRTGRTLAHIIRLCLSEGKPITISGRDWHNLYADEYHGLHYEACYRSELREIYAKLQGTDLKLRKIEFKGRV